VLSSRQQARRQERLDAVLAAAWEIAAESGLGAVTLHDVARRVGLRQPSLYVYVDSKLGLFDAMYAQAYGELLARLAALPGGGSARLRLMRVSRVILDFVVSQPPRQQLLFQRTIPGFTPSEPSYALAEKLVVQVTALLAEVGASRPEQVDVYTALIAGLGAQQIANDPGGDRWSRLLEPVLNCFLDHCRTEDLP